MFAIDLQNGLDDEGAYRLRGGSAVFEASVPFEDVMKERFGHVDGKTII